MLRYNMATDTGKTAETRNTVDTRITVDTGNTVDTEKTVVVIDGQGGRLGRMLVERIRADRLDCRIRAVGTNTLATSAMLKAGADEAATGENPVISRRTPCSARSRPPWPPPSGAAVPKSCFCR